MIVSGSGNKSFIKEFISIQTPSSFQELSHHLNTHISCIESMPTVNGWKADGNSTLDLKSSDPNGLKGFMSVISVRDIFPRIASGNILLLLQCSKEVRCQVSNEVIPVSHLNLRALNYDERHRQGYACQHPHIHTGAVKCFRTSFCRDSEIVVNYDIGASGCPLCLIGPLLSKVSKAASVGIVLEEVCSPVQADVFAALAYLQRTAPGELKLQRLHWESTNSQQVGHEDDMYFSELCPTGTVVMALSGGGLRDVFLRDVPDRVVLAEISSALLQSMDTVRRVDIMDDRSPRERTRCDEKLGELHHSIPTLLNALQTLTSMEQLCLRGKGISLVVAPMTVIEAVFDSAKNLRILKLEHIPLRVHLVPPLISAIVRKIGHCLEVIFLSHPSHVPGLAVLLISGCGRSCLCRGWCNPKKSCGLFCPVCPCCIVYGCWWWSTCIHGRKLHRKSRRE